MNRQIVDRGRDFAGADFERFVNIPPHGRLTIDGFGNMWGVSLSECFTCFNRPPAVAVTVGTELDVLTVSTGTVQVTAPAPKGGVNLKTRNATAGTDGDLVGLKPALTTNAFNIPVRAGSVARFATRIALSQVIKAVAFFGLDQSILRYDPTATAGEGAGFLFVDDVTQLVSSAGLVAGAANTGGVIPLVPATPYANWILSQKVGGVDTFIATDVPVTAAQDYELVMTIGEDLKPSYYINGRFVGKGVAGVAATENIAVGIEIGGDDTAVVKEHDFDIRYLSLARGIGA